MVFFYSPLTYLHLPASRHIPEQQRHERQLYGPHIMRWNPPGGGGVVTGMSIAETICLLFVEVTMYNYSTYWKYQAFWVSHRKRVYRSNAFTIYKETLRVRIYRSPSREHLLVCRQYLYPNKAINIANYSSDQEILYCRIWTFIGAPTIRDWISSWDSLIHLIARNILYFSSNLRLCRQRRFS